MPLDTKTGVLIATVLKKKWWKIWLHTFNFYSSQVSIFASVLVLLFNSNAGDATVNIDSNSSTVIDFLSHSGSEEQSHGLRLTATQLCKIEYEAAKHSPMRINSTLWVFGTHTNHDLWMCSNLILWISAFGYAVYMGRLIMRDYVDITGFNDGDSYGLSRNRRKLSFRGFAFLQDSCWQISVPIGFAKDSSTNTSKCTWMTFHAREFLPFKPAGTHTNGAVLEEDVLVYDYIFLEALAVCLVVVALSGSSHLLLCRIAFFAESRFSVALLEDSVCICRVSTKFVLQLTLAVGLLLSKALSTLVRIYDAEKKSRLLFFTGNFKVLDYILTALDDYNPQKSDQVRRHASMALHQRSAKELSAKLATAATAVTVTSAGAAYPQRDGAGDSPQSSTCLSTVGLPSLSDIIEEEEDEDEDEDEEKEEDEEAEEEQKKNR